jgi:hypothetical protein
MNKIEKHQFSAGGGELMLFLYFPFQMDKVIKQNTPPLVECSV